jgi:protein-S-isoprenylcysteine O-methyltransferase Ste14
LTVNDDFEPFSWERAGGWLFKRRTWLPVPLALALLFVRTGEASSSLPVIIGTATVLSAELLRLWAVNHIGVISRTRSDRLGPLVTTGPFAIMRNPLYLGNIGLWVGFALTARLVWLVPIFVVILGLEYHAIVHWEEELLQTRRGAEYRSYASRVHRWMPSFRVHGVENARATHSWSETLFSERGTLIAIAVGYLLLWIKSQV